MPVIMSTMTEELLGNPLSDYLLTTNTEPTQILRSLQLTLDHGTAESPMAPESRQERTTGLER